jgi:hypothetical protein
MTGATCSTCGAPIIWAHTTKGKRIPLDAKPHPDGNVMLTGGGTAVVAGKSQNGARRYMPHHATCSHPVRRGRR